MIRNKDLFTTLDKLVYSKVKFSDESTVNMEGEGSIIIQEKDGGHSRITDVLYVPTIKNNLLSLGQLLERRCTQRKWSKGT